MQTNPRATLLVSGYGGSEPISNTQLYSMVAQEYPIPASRIYLFESPRDTTEEAALMAPIIKQGNGALATSASHMRHALPIFQALGATPWPLNTPYFHEQLPSSTDLDRVTIA